MTTDTRMRRNVSRILFNALYKRKRYSVLAATGNSLPKGWPFNAPDADQSPNQCAAVKLKAGGWFNPTKQVGNESVVCTSANVFGPRSPKWAEPFLYWRSFTRTIRTFTMSYRIRTCNRHQMVFFQKILINNNDNKTFI